MKPFIPHRELFSVVTGRSESFLTADLASRSEAIRAAIGGARVLVIGGAGTIGGATIRALLPFQPAVLHVVDQNENGLAELVRDLRSDKSELSVKELKTLPINFASTLMERLLGSGRYDFVLNFAALKHVRSEKDELSLLQMLYTNVAAAERLLEWIAQAQTPTRYFCVSTDKAANPVSLMGASKRIMERVIFAGKHPAIQVTSARFANVAFSQGSLLESWLARMTRQQPLATPVQTRRYFVSIEEAGQICLLAALCAPDQHLLIPSLDPEKELRDLESTAQAVVEYYGYKARFYDDEKSAKDHYTSDTAAGYYPIVQTPLDTSGEKPYEEFVGEGESVKEIGLKALKAIPCADASASSTADFVKRITRGMNGDGAHVTKADIVGWMSEIVPQLRHRETGKSLDDRM